MENKNVGYLILGISVVLIFIIFLFQNALQDIVKASCSLDIAHAASCPIYKTIKQQTYLSLGIVSLLIIIGLVLIFTKQKEKVVVKKISERKKKIDFSKLDKDEKRVIELLLQENNAMFQSSLMEKLEIGKVKATRLLDKLEAKQLIERKRRGLNNMIVLKD